MDDTISTSLLGPQGLTPGTGDLYDYEYADIEPGLQADWKMKVGTGLRRQLDRPGGPAARACGVG